MVKLRSAVKIALFAQGYRSYVSRIDFFVEAQLAHLNKTTSCEADVATR